MEKFLQILLISVLTLFAWVLNAAEKETAANASHVLKPQVANFNAVTVAGIFNINIMMGQPRSVVISGDPELLNKLQVAVKNSTLAIHYPKHFSSKSINVPTITINTPQLTELTAEGNNKIDIMQLKNSEFSLRVHGNQKIHLSGIADTFSIEIAGEAKLDAQNLVAKKALLNASGDADVTLNVLDELHTRTMGNVQVKVHGHPKIVTTSMMGNGHVEAVTD